MPGIIGMPGMPMQQPPHGPQPQQPAEAKNTNTKILYNIYTFVYVRVCVCLRICMYLCLHIYTSTLFIAQNQGPQLRP